MRHWWLIFALTLYLSLDVANPLMPGAVSFGIDDSVELRQAERFRADHDVVTPAQALARTGYIDAEVVIQPLRPVEPVWTASPRVQRARSSLFAHASPSEDTLSLRS